MANVTLIFYHVGGPCSLIAVIGGPLIEGLGFAYILTSAGAAFIMLTVALLGNNMMPTRQYPMYWN
jgi:CBS-domain-containing membrane protein